MSTKRGFDGGGGGAGTAGVGVATGVAVGVGVGIGELDDSAVGLAAEAALSARDGCCVVPRPTSTPTNTPSVRRSAIAKATAAYFHSFSRIGRRDYRAANHRIATASRAAHPGPGNLADSQGAITPSHHGQPKWTTSTAQTMSVRSTPTTFPTIKNRL